MRPKSLHVLSAEIEGVGITSPIACFYALGSSITFHEEGVKKIEFTVQDYRLCITVLNNMREPLFVIVNVRFDDSKWSGTVMLHKKDLSTLLLCNSVAKLCRIDKLIAKEGVILTLLKRIAGEISMFEMAGYQVDEKTMKVIDLLESTPLQNLLKENTKHDTLQSFVRAYLRGDAKLNEIAKDFITTVREKFGLDGAILSRPL